MGGTKTEAVLLDDSLVVLEKRRVPTERQYGAILGMVERLVSGLLSESRRTDMHVGMCMPGTVSDSGDVIQCNISCLAGMPFRQDLQARLGRDIMLANDADCFVMAEALMGSCQGFHSVFGAIMGTGVGGGICVDKRLYRGSSGLAGEWGHHILHPNGRDCYCGMQGCAEAYLSGVALEKRWHELTGEWQRMPDIVRSLDSPAGRQLKSEWLADFGLGIANVISMLDPDVIVLGGGLSNVGFLYTQGRQSVLETISGGRHTPILRNSLGDSAGVFGAAMLGHEFT